MHERVKRIASTPFFWVLYEKDNSLEQKVRHNGIQKNKIEAICKQWCNPAFTKFVHIAGNTPYIMI